MDKEPIKFKNYEEIIEFFNNPIIRKEIQLTELNTTRSVATEMLRKLLKSYIDTIDCDSFDIKWEKGKEFRKFNICFEKH